MADLKLAKLPDRTPVKVTIMITPALHANLARYADLYAASYDHSASISDLIPAMLEAFLASDRAFARQKNVIGSGGD